MSQLDHRYVDVGGDLVIHTAVSGAGPAVVLLHGFTGSTETWADLRQSIESSNTVIAVDLPGHGLSSAPSDPYRYALPRFADDLAVILDELSIDGAAVLGYSMGGRAALQFALEYGSRVERLILESTSPGIVDPAERAKRVASDDALADSIEQNGLESFVDSWEAVPLWATQGSLAADKRARLRSQRLKNSPTGLANSLRGAGAGIDDPVVDRLSEIEASVLLVTGALDIKYTNFAEQMARSLGNCRTAVIPSSGHAVHFEQPEAFNEAVATFLSLN